MTHQILTYYLPVQDDVSIERAKELVTEFKKEFPSITVDILPSWTNREGYDLVQYEVGPPGSITVPIGVGGYGIPNTSGTPLQWAATTSEGQPNMYTATN